MAEGFYAELIKILKKHGFSFVRPGKGSHEIWENPQGQQAHVPRNCKSRFTAAAVLKQAGIKDERI